MSKFNIEDPLGLAELTAKTCVICQFADNQEDIVETGDGYCHAECLKDDEIKYAEVLSEENNEKLI